MGKVADVALWLPMQTDHYVIAPVGRATVKAAKRVLPPGIRANRVVQRVWNEVRKPNGPVRLGIDSGVAYGAVTVVALSVLDALTPGRLWGSIADFYTKHPVQAGLVTGASLAGIVTATDVAVSAARHAYSNVATRGRALGRNAALTGSTLLLLVAAGLYDRVDRGSMFIWEQPPRAPAAGEMTPTPSPTLEGIVTLTPTSEATVTTAPTPTSTPYATATPTQTPTPQPTATPTPSATATPVPTATPTPQPTATPTAQATPTPIAGLEAITKAQRFGLSYNLVRDMLGTNTAGFYQAFGVVQAAQAQVPNWFDGNPANGEVVPRDNVAVMVDGVSGQSRFYLQNNASATFKTPLQAVIDFVVKYLAANPGRVGEVSVK